MNQASGSKESKSVQKVRFFKSPSGTLVRPVQLGGIIITRVPSNSTASTSAAKTQEPPIVKLEPQIVKFEPQVVKFEPQVLKFEPHEFVVQTQPQPFRQQIAVSNVTPITYQSSNGHYTTTSTTVQYTQADDEEQIAGVSSPYVIVQPSNIDTTQYIIDTSQSNNDPEDTEEIYFETGEADSENESLESIEAVIEYLRATTALIERKFAAATKRYRKILEDLLRLKNIFVRKTVSRSIKQRRYYRHSIELLDVIFESFGVILRSVKLDHLPSNVRFIAISICSYRQQFVSSRYIDKWIII